MNIVLAQIKKDIQCQRTPLILWVVCIALGILILVTSVTLVHAPVTALAHLEDAPMQKMVGFFSVVALIVGSTFMVGFAMFLLLPILVIRIVHEDTLMGTTAFWLTRPIPREKLLLAKALFIAALVLPLVLSVRNGMQMGAAHFWCAEIAWIATLAALASMTPGVQALLGYGVALLFGKIIFSAIIDRVWNHYHGDGSIYPDGLIHVFSSAGQMLHLNSSDFFELCYFVGFSAVFIHQYLTLRTRRSLAIYVAILVTVGVFQMFVAEPMPLIQVQTYHSP